MIITKMALPRRTFLRGIGAAIALPFLDSMVPALRAAATTTSGVLTTELWSACRGGSIVQLDTIAGGGHTWYGAVPGEPSSTQLVWGFFSHLSVAA